MDACEIIPGVVGDARFATPLSVYHEFVFVMALCEWERDRPLTIRQVVVKRCGIGFPIVKSAGDEDRFRLGRVTGNFNGFHLGSFHFIRVCGFLCVTCPSFQAEERQWELPKNKKAAVAAS